MSEPNANAIKNPSRPATNVRTITSLAMLAAIAYVVMLLSKMLPQVSGFLQMDLKDTVICIGAFLFGPLSAAVISIEAPGANDVGVYHNAGGLDVSALEAKSLALWEKLRALGVPSVAIGDLGNEIGMGKIADHIRSFVPFTAHGECSCGCKGGILAASTADTD